MWRAAAFLRQRKYCQTKPWYVLYHSKLQPIHWSVSATNYTGDRLPSVQPSAESACNPVMLPGSPSTTPGCQTLQCDWLHKVFYSLKTFTLPPCAWTIYIFTTENRQQRVLPEMADLPQGKGEQHNSPSLPALWSRRYSGLRERICRRRQC